MTLNVHVDYSRFGDTNTVLVWTRDGEEPFREEVPANDALHTADFIAVRASFRRRKGEQVVVTLDDVGVGAALADMIRRVDPSLKVVLESAYEKAAKVVDISRARNKRLPTAPYLDVSRHDPAEVPEWLQKVFANGVARTGVTGLWFGIDGHPGVIISAAQARALGEALLQVADHLESEDGR